LRPIVRIHKNSSTCCTPLTPSPVSAAKPIGPCNGISPSSDNGQETILNNLSESEHSKRKLNHTSQPMTKQKNLLLSWNQTISTLEMSIELSKANHFRTCDREEQGILPGAAIERDLAMLSADFANGIALEPLEKNQNTSSWFDFSFHAKKQKGSGQCRYQSEEESKASSSRISKIFTHSRII
jgi:hypothetical protein